MWSSIKGNHFRLLVIVLLGSLSTTLLAQPKTPRSTITGRVIDAATRQPMENVSVFLDNTTKGDASDKNGHFEITNIPPGIYTLVASMVGYHMQKAALELRSSKEIVRNFRLSSKVFQFRPLEVTADNAKEWRKNLKRFERHFIGTSKFARQTEILNPQYLDFKKSPTGAFFARQKRPLK